MAVYVVLTILLVPLVGLLLAATPWLMSQRECFAVTVPAAAQNDPSVVRLKRGYAAALVAATAVLTAVDIALFACGWGEAGFVAMAVAAVALCALSFALMLRCRARVRALKEERGWQASGDVRSAVVAEEDLPRPLSLRWELLHVPVILATLLIGIVGYPSMPDLVPMHAGLDGTVDSWAEKSPLILLMVPGVQLFLLACFCFSHVSISRSKRPVRPDAPASSAYAYGLFARAQSAYTVAVGLLTSVGFIAMQFALLGRCGIGFAGVLLLGVALVAVVGAVAMSLVYGQSGARVMARVGDPTAMPQDDDRHWKLGVFYANRGDPSVFVPERFGIGWTCNFGRPAAWAFLGGFVVLTAAFIAVVALLAG